MRARKRVPAGSENSLADVGLTVVRRTVVRLRKTGRRVWANVSTEPVTRTIKKSNEIYLIVNICLPNIFIPLILVKKLPLMRFENLPRPLSKIKCRAGLPLYFNTLEASARKT